jgi:3alpha(or 20beta)-hydroxysteroid dehydrogenase
MAGRLEGRVAIVTGAARGQGAAEAELFVQEGARVLLTDVDATAGEELSARLGQLAEFLPHDVREEAAWTRVLGRCEETFGLPTILVNNAGTMPVGKIESMAVDEFRGALEVNVIGSLLGIRTVIEPMRRAGGGSIVNVSSVAGMKGVAGVMGYVASKWAIRGMTKAAALELGVHGIRVNSVHPGTIDTDMVNGPEFADVDRDAYFRNMPVPRMGRPEDVANVVAFLASDASAYCTGGEFLVDGGDLAGTPVPREMK